MSRTQSAHRLPLLAGSSLAALGLSCVAAFGVAFAPDPAAAQACTPAPATVALPGADTVNCIAGTYNPGITYNANGDLTVTTTGNITVSSTAPGAVAEKGINLTATGTDSITWISAPVGSVAGGNLTGGAQTSGPILDVATVDGDIDITAGRIAGTNATITHAIRAIASGSGDVTVNTIIVGQGNRSITASHSGNTAGAAIEARTTTGDLLLNLGMVDTSAGDTINGGPSPAVRTVSGGASIINIGDRTTLTSGVGGANATPVNAVLDMTIDSGVMTVNNAGVIKSNASAGFVHDDRAVMAEGAGRLNFNNNGSLVGQVDFSGLLQGVVFTNTMRRAPQSDASGEYGWRTRGVSRFTGGDDILATTLSGGVMTGVVASQAVGELQPIGGAQTELDFGEGDDLFDNRGRFAVGVGKSCISQAIDQPSCSLRETTTTLSGLETFRNSGVIYLGYQQLTYIVGQELSDYQPNDRLIMRGATYIGDGGRIELDVDLGSAVGQSSCVGSTEATALFFAAADCIDLQGGATEGETLVLIRQAVFPGGGPKIAGESELNTDLRADTRGGYFPDPIVVVDVSGGTSGAGHFVLDPNSVMYTPAHGGVLDEGLFLYALTYDEANTQHVVVSLPGGAAQFGPMAQVAQGLWRSSAGSFFQRQSELRATGDFADLSGGFWVRGSAETAKRDRLRSIPAGGTTFTLDDSYDTDTYGLTFGVDLLAAQQGGASYNLGFMGGYSHAGVDFREGPNSAAFDGFTGGAYGGVRSGSFFLDAALNVNQMEMANTIPALGLDEVDLRAYNSVIPGIDTGSPELTHSVRSVGARLETGWRLSVADNIFVEPLASLDYVRTTFEDISVRPPLDIFGGPAVLITFDDVTSLRGTVGARLGINSALGPVNVRYSVLGRVGNEFEGDVRYLVDNPGADLWLGDDLGGQFSEIGGAIDLFNEAGTLNFFLSASGEFADDFESLGLSLGGRFRW